MFLTDVIYLRIQYKKLIVLSPQYPLISLFKLNKLTFNNKGK